MRHWLSLQPDLAAVARGPLALCFDFDGTLAPIAPRPELVQLQPGIPELLEHLAGDPLIRMAVVSGRALADVRPRVAVDGLRFAGNHGLELDDGTIVVPPPPLYRDELEVCRMELPGRLRAPGVWIEDKTLTLTVHVRATPPEFWDEVHATIAEFIETRTTIGMRKGHAVIELRPRHGATKADAVAALLRQWEVPPERLWFFGDDETDEDVFRRFPTGVMLRIQSKPESAARGHLNDPADLVVLLQWLRECRRESRSTEELHLGNETSPTASKTEPCSSGDST